MSVVDQSLPAAESAAQDATAKSRFGERLEAFLVRVGERLNPILVKETRQALKSRQFTVTFALLLMCGWVWSLIGVVFAEGVHLGGQGAWIFYGYHLVLAFPLMVIVPFGAYRSLASEWEDGTYELMSISLLNPRQIVAGKLGSAVLQMIVYLSALSPCIAFTYLLKGIDLPTILWVLFWLVVFSLGSTVVALCAATLTRARHWQVLISVALIAGMLFEFFGLGMAFIGALIERPWMFLAFGDFYFWVGNAMFLTGFLAFGALFFLIARARLLFNSENRSTAVRLCMLAHHALFTGWMAWGFLFEESDIDRESIPLISMMMVGIYWWVMGAFLTGENPELSQRVKRSLPQSFLGRMFFTWLNPGSGTGYVFAMCNLASYALLVFATLLIGWNIPSFGGSWAAVDVWRIFLFGELGLCYVAIFLGVGRLLILALRKIAPVNLVLGALIHVILFLAATFLPLTIQAMSPALRFQDYTLLQVSNAPWTLDEIAWGGLPAQTGELLLILNITAAIVVFLNLPSLAREVRQLRIAKPKRVAEEDAQLAPPPKPPEYKSPWDEDTGTSTAGAPV